MAASGSWRARLCFHFGGKNAAPSLLLPEIRFYLFRSFASNYPETEALPFSVAYLKKSFGFPLETARALSKYFPFEAPERPDSVVNFFKGQGFTDGQISVIVRTNPLVLSFTAERLLSKLEFFRSVGCCDADVCTIFSKNPSLLRLSLQKRIIPCYNLLKSVLLLDSEVIKCFKRRLINARHNPETLASNIRLFRELGPPQSAISNLLKHFTHIAFTRHSAVKETVNEIGRMGFDPSTTIFCYAVFVRRGMNKQTWESKFEIYRRWGWSRDDTLTAFGKCQGCMRLSEEKITRVMDLLVNKMGWRSHDIAYFPYPLIYSMEKRIVPRCSVLHVLRLKGLIGKDINLSSLLISSEEDFINKYVASFLENVPQLLSLYKGKIDLTDLGIKPIVP